MKYNLTVCGGTFDLLHNGHKSFLTQILDVSENVILGLTSDAYTKKFKDRTYEDFQTRKKNLQDFLKSNNSLDRVKITSIDDIYGPLLSKDLKADALAVTPQTNRTAIGINKEREDIGILPVEILVIKMDPADDGSLISSSRIRKGEINREGKLYIDPDWDSKRLILPQSLREELAKPFGKVLKGVPDILNAEQTITVGDETTKRFNGKLINQKLSIIDFAVKRQKKFDRLDQLGFEQRIKTEAVENPAGEISWELFDTIRKSLSSSERNVILVNGEEDLAVLPAILVSPLGWNIYYGQPDEGIVEVYVDEAIKQKAKELASKFQLS